MGSENHQWTARQTINHQLIANASIMELLFCLFIKRQSTSDRNLTDSAENTNRKFVLNVNIFERFWKQPHV